ncbi:hypothetical protein LJB76_01525 [Clostridia bacterium OttesenSCG-928-O13]|nr:hypothetical protein [Clostridia bacterium OttesenSCG-928-O13]
MSANTFDDLVKQIHKKGSPKGKQSYTDLFPPSFMKQKTKFKTFDEFLDGLDFPKPTIRDPESLPQNTIDTYVKRNTKFSSWKAMKEEGATQLVAKNLDVK